MFDILLRNELKTWLLHEPTEKEFESAKKHIDFYFDETQDFSALSCLITEWREDNCKCCSECGEYHLIDDMTHKARNIKTDLWFCSNKCEVNYFNY